MAAGLSVDLDGWRREFDELMLRAGGRFARVEPRRRMAAFVRGLLAGLPRVNCWSIAEHAGEEHPRGMQRLLSAAVWDEAGVRDDLRGYVLEHFADPGAVLVVDETRCAAAGVPDGVDFATEPALARQMITRAGSLGCRREASYSRLPRHMRHARHHRRCLHGQQPHRQTRAAARGDRKRHRKTAGGEPGTVKRSLLSPVHDHRAGSRPVRIRCQCHSPGFHRCGREHAHQVRSRFPEHPHLVPPARRVQAHRHGGYLLRTVPLSPRPARGRLDCCRSQAVRPRRDSPHHNHIRKAIAPQALCADHEVSLEYRLRVSSSRGATWVDEKHGVVWLCAAQRREEGSDMWLNHPLDEAVELSTDEFAGTFGAQETRDQIERHYRRITGRSS
jgi:hypothetical protein